jgi:uncharacterized membrane protein
MTAASLARPLLPDDAGALDDFLGWTCHRMPSRCLELPWGISGLCARCTAFWAGLGLSAFALLLSGARPRFLPGALLLAPMAIDGGLQYLGVYESLQVVRIATGLLAGAGTAALMLFLAGGMATARPAGGRRPAPG